MFMGLCEALKIPGWCQLAIIAQASLWGIGRFDYLGGICAAESSPMALKYLGMWVFGPNGYGCPVWARWVHWYTVFYVACFHYLRSAIMYCARAAPAGPAWAAAATGTSMLLGMLM